MNELEKAERAIDYKYKIDLIHLSFQEMAHPHKIVWEDDRCKFIFKCVLCGRQADKFVHPIKPFYMNCRYCIGTDTKKRNVIYKRVLSKAY